MLLGKLCVAWDGMAWGEGVDVRCAWDGMGLDHVVSFRWGVRQREFGDPRIQVGVPGGSRRAGRQRDYQGHPKNPMIETARQT